ncbi:hypothetical protein TraAM80_08118 [Trypanosoma rangeli]|uniref:Uncharacterized protein n=1 Tax=Trypanosoma rangeli TaxID=5698 RepID=A0A3R7KR12_TRYRA|nr:uncharacterized protein TraAM80_08118 [Trypanosoma rangeli]RNE99644.1 hypothetical protein TraAM80_08118 [Trypanosoma rangeli]|eukprot:RNE99644.1 hypothetical protein TraAM80_08118 [Trypanosoma rangeli]
MKYCQYRLPSARAAIVEVDKHRVQGGTPQDALRRVNVPTTDSSKKFKKEQCRASKNGMRKIRKPKMFSILTTGKRGCKIQEELMVMMLRVREVGSRQNSQGLTAEVTP